MKALVATLALVCCSGVANAAGRSSDKYMITAEEQSACGSDAIALCASAYPDEDKLLACMKTNRSSLSMMCRPIFDEGMRRRHLN